MPKGFAYVDFDTVRAAELAKDFANRNGGTSFAGKRIEIWFARARPGKEGAGGAAALPSTTLCLKNLPQTVNDGALTSYFSNAKSVKVVTDRNTGASRGFAFVEFNSVEEAVAAKDGTDGTEVGGNTISVEFKLARRGGGGRHMGSPEGGGGGVGGGGRKRSGADGDNSGKRRKGSGGSGFGGGGGSGGGGGGGGFGSGGGGGGFGAFGGGGGGGFGGGGKKVRGRGGTAPRMVEG